MRNLINIINEAELDATATDMALPTTGQVAKPAPVQKPAGPKVSAKPQSAPEPDLATIDDNQRVLPVLFNALANIGAVDPIVLKDLSKAQTEKQKKEIMNRVVVEKHDKGRISALRTQFINSTQLRQAAATLGLKEVMQLTDEQRAASGQFVVHSFLTPNGVTITVVLAGRNKAAIAAGLGDELVLNRKDLTPVKLGLAGKTIPGIYTNRSSLAASTKKAIANKIKDTNLATALNELIDLALNRGAGQLSPESLEYIKPIIGSISQDFGEVLAPIALAQDDEDITFPGGNEKLIDVTVGGKVRYSVKALGGSGTSMNSLGSLLHDYELTLTDEGKKKLFQDGIRIWQSTKAEGSVTDRICLAASRNQIPEYLSYVDILGDEFNSFAELKSLLTPLVKNLDYVGFLKMILPATQAGHWGINIGMPADSKYYMGLTDKKPVPGQAGKNSYDHNPVDGAANIIAYSMGKGMEFMIKRGPNKQQYKDVMNDMIQQLNCQLGHVDIDSLGQLVITSKPFGNLDFDFDYHAPSYSAGNNRPGFMIVPPNMKKPKAVSEMRERRTFVDVGRKRRG